MFDALKSKIYSIISSLQPTAKPVYNPAPELAQIAMQPAQQRINNIVAPLRQQAQTMATPPTTFGLPQTQTRLNMPSSNPVDRINSILQSAGGQYYQPITGQQPKAPTLQEKVNNIYQDLNKTMAPKIQDRIKTIFNDLSAKVGPTLHQIDPTTQDPNAWINSNQGFLGQARRWSFENLWTPEQKQGQQLESKALSGGKLTPQESELVSKYQKEKYLNMVMGAVDAGPAVGGKLSKNLLTKLYPEADAIAMKGESVANKLIPSIDEVARVEGQTMRESQLAMEAGNNQGMYQDAYTKMKNFVRLAGEKKSTETGELFREHIPQSVFGQSSDELAQSLNMTENELMAKIQSDIATPSTLRTSTRPGSYTNVRSIDNRILDDGWDQLIRGESKQGMSTVAEDISTITKHKATPAINLNPYDEIINRPEINVKQKANIIDWLRTPNRVLTKIGLGEEAKGLRTAYDKYVSDLPTEIDKITAWSKRVTPDANERIFNYLDGKLPRLDNPTELEVATEIKSYLKDWAKKLKLPEENQISNYITHIFEKGKIQKEFDPEVSKLIRGQVSKSVWDPFLQRRVGQPEYIQDTWQALDAYTKRAVRKYSLDPILEKIAGKAENLPEESYNYVKSQIARINMQPTAIDNLIDNAIKSSPIGYKLGQRPVTAVSKNARQMIFRGLLGLNPLSAIRNMTQALNAYPALKEKYFFQGIIKTVTELPNFIIHKSTELEKSGVLNNMVEDRAISATKKFWETADKNGFFYLFNLAESWNRGIAYYGGKAKALSEGKTLDQALEYAKRLVRDTQFSYDVVDTPAVLQSDIAKTLFQFGTYPLKQGEFLIEMAKRKDIAGSIRWLASNLLVIATIGQIIGLKPTDLIPQFKFGVPPTLQAPVGVYKAVTQSTDQYGNQLSPTQRIFNKDLTTGLMNYVPAGGQLRKMYEGVSSGIQGGSYTPSGMLRYPANLNLANTAFGTNVTPQAQNYYGNNIPPLGKAQTEQYKQLIQSGMTPDQAYKVFTDQRAQDQQFKDILNEQGNGSSTNGQPTAPTITTGNNIMDMYNAEKASSEKQTKIKAILDLNLPTDTTDKMLQQAGLGTIEEAQAGILKGLSVDNRSTYVNQELQGLSYNDFLKKAVDLANKEILTTGISADLLDKGLIDINGQKMLNQIIAYTKNKKSSPIATGGNAKGFSRPTMTKLKMPTVKKSTMKTIKVPTFKPLKGISTSSYKELQRKVALKISKARVN